MPRFPQSLFRQARSIDRFLPRLLRPCGDLRTAQNELRWLREHAGSASGGKGGDVLLKQMIEERATGKPLQYILGTEYFGPLELECRPGVLIPRQETAASVTHLVNLLRQSQELPAELRVLDLCTGTGCIPLLFRHELNAKRTNINVRCVGVDVSETALKLAQDNLLRVGKDGHPQTESSVNFLQADVLANSVGDGGGLSVKSALNWHRQPPFWDILISNPPYISPKDYRRTTTRSVREFEPKLALVPPEPPENITVPQEDLFYPALLDAASNVEAKIVLFEVADLDQAVRVANMARARGIFKGIEIWRDQPDGKDETTTPANEYEFPVLGSGHGRSVLCWNSVGAIWLKKGAHTHEKEDIGDDCHGDEDHLQPKFDWSTFINYEHKRRIRLVGTIRPIQ